jgi:hypothetical protein
MARVVEATRREKDMKNPDALTVVRAYHRAWSGGNFEAAGRLLADGLEVDVPINTCRSKADFLEAVRRTRQMTSSIDMLAEFGGDREALLLYDMTLPFGPLRVAEHFAVSGGRITRIRHVHDTAALRAAGGVPRSDGDRAPTAP